MGKTQLQIEYNLSKPSERSERSERGLVAQTGSYPCLWYLMISHIPRPICVKLAGVVGGNSESDLGKKKFQNVDIEKIFLFHFFSLSSCNLTLTYLCMCDDSLGFEDCRCATHLLNFTDVSAYVQYVHKDVTSYHA